MPANTAVSAWPAALALVVNALVWGLSWWPFRWLDARGVHPLWATAVIYGTCALAVSIVRPRAWRDMRHGALWAIALGSGLTNACFNWAVATGDVVRVVLLFYLMPLWAVLLARWLLGERITGVALLRVALALVGAAIVLGAASAPSGGAGPPLHLPLPSSLPDVLALIGGAAFAFNNVMLRRERLRSEAARTLAMFVGGSVLAGIAALAGGPAGVVPLPHGDALHLGMIAALAFAFLVANIALQYGAARLSANATAVIMLIEVVFASVSAWLLGAAELGPRVLIGGALILAATLLAARASAADPPLP